MEPNSKEKYGKCFKYEESFFWVKLKEQLDDTDNKLRKIRTDLSYMRMVNNKRILGAYKTFSPQEFEDLVVKREILNIFKAGVEQRMRVMERKMDDGDEVTLSSWMNV